MPHRAVSFKPVTESPWGGSRPQYIVFLPEDLQRLGDRARRGIAADRVYVPIGPWTGAWADPNGLLTVIREADKGSAP